MKLFSPRSAAVALLAAVVLVAAGLGFLFWWSHPAPRPRAGTLPPRQQSRVAIPVADGAPCTIERVTDGDTVVCADERRIRLLGIDAPERAQKPYGARAGRELAELLPPGTRAEVELDVRGRDRYGRILAYLYAPDRRMANREMVRRGYALVLTYPPNVRYVDALRTAQDEARRARSGLWATDAWECAPRDFRARRCRSAPATVP